jgi:hypothetical protein
MYKPGENFMEGNVNKAVDSHERAERDQYDRGIIPAETAARKEREGERYKTKPSEQGNEDVDSDSIRTTDGYTVDNEGLINNYAVEPEMYYEEPGDARKMAEEEKQLRAQELEEINDGSEGELTMDGDKRGKGTGAV